MKKCAASLQAEPAKANGPCDKCDGAHATERCPHFKGKARDKHKDAWDKYGATGDGGDDGDGEVGEGYESVCCCTGLCVCVCFVLFTSYESSNCSRVVRIERIEPSDRGSSRLAGSSRQTACAIVAGSSGSSRVV